MFGRDLDSRGLVKLDRSFFQSELLTSGKLPISGLPGGPGGYRLPLGGDWRDEEAAT